MFDKTITDHLSAPAVRGTFTRGTALSLLLRGTDVSYRVVAGSFALYRLPKSENADFRDTARDLPIPEILVMGRRSQNVDIRRSTNDIRPYKVLERSKFAEATRDDLNEILRTELTANAASAAPAQILRNAGDSRSSIDLRGLGPDRTLVLVDGRRFPTIPTFTLDNLQPDINAIPLIAIERVESITSTAGGTYGPGALGGAVNIVLRQKMRGVEMRGTAGLSSRGDAGTTSLETMIGLRSSDDRTGIMLVGGLRKANGLLRKNRDYSERQRKLQFKNDPAGYSPLRYAANSGGFYRFTDSVTVYSSSGEPLRLKPEYGGANLGSAYSYLPSSFSGSRNEAITLLQANAGKLTFDSAPDLRDGEASLLPRVQSEAALVNLDHRFGDAFEVYVSGAWLQNRSRYDFADGEQTVTYPFAPTNPFQQSVVFTLPRPDLIGLYTQKIVTTHMTTGVTASLGGHWRLNIDASLGRVRVSNASVNSVVSFPLLNALLTGKPGGLDLPVVDPLAPEAERNAALLAYRETGRTSQVLTNHFYDASLRLAGPLVHLPGGPLTATASAEWRRETVPETQRVSNFPASKRVLDNSPRQVQVASALLELRAPITGSDQRLPFLRKLEVQLALRGDSSRTLYPTSFGSILPGQEPETRSHRLALTYTAGVRIRPRHNLLLRLSSATGELPPTIRNLQSTFGYFVNSDALLADSKRGGRPVGSERSFIFLYGGSPDSPPERARGISAGLVLNPDPRRWPQFSLDYSHIHRTREPYVLSYIFFDDENALARVPEVLAREGSDPGRLRRLPLTDADAALGFTAGIVTHVDGRGVNDGETVLKSLDADLSWQLPATRFGIFDLNASATWTSSLRHRISGTRLSTERAGYADGPVKWRGVLSLDWHLGSSSAGLRANYTGSYRPIYGSPADAQYNPQILRFQGRQRIPQQVTFDLRVGQTLAVGVGVLKRAQVELVIANVFDASPPITADPQTLGYSTYADPRRRRFSLALGTAF
ncbi:TonB-dependent receptor plug domain-containing protein [Sphingomonas sp. BN140010]|uniref:TonB-dependent receptor plug domain-containing protein n=1 Tax=Sphingomonas arvum TaxID=2992113 RepID=A0ABT3JDX3_9SPHN|nr:TonB-dependent receptor plug domain-containing protein [Sphingomonas sp. BN140010]MCW3797204.1 TonB-dependent receptor plug domain-containing protein [Sphingomonas sp. BN140010]